MKKIVGIIVLIILILLIVVLVLKRMIGTKECRMEYKWVCPEWLEECYRTMENCSDCDIACPAQSEWNDCEYMEVEVCG